MEDRGLGVWWDLERRAKQSFPRVGRHCWETGGRLQVRVRKESGPEARPTPRSCEASIPLDPAVPLRNAAGHYQARATAFSRHLVLSIHC